MPYLIGTDEAGYGPNLGPLLISVSVWRVPSLEVDLYEQLSAGLTATPAGAGTKLALADSKKLYSSQKSIALLERGLLATLTHLGHPNESGEVPLTWQACWRLLTADGGAATDTAPWYTGFDRDLPLAADAASIACGADQLTAPLQNAGVQLVRLRSRAIFPREFNALCREFGTKGAVLTDQTIRLLAEELAQLEAPQAKEACRVVCDKHGGRNRYGSVLQHYFPDHQLQIERESRPASCYKLDAPGQELSISFQVGGEEFLPAALASMASKYLRELAMLALTAYWFEAVPGLKPTAGYPVDAKRFHAEIRSIQQQRQIDDDLLWRHR